MACQGMQIINVLCVLFQVILAGKLELLVSSSHLLNFGPDFKNKLKC